MYNISLIYSVGIWRCTCAESENVIVYPSLLLFGSVIFAWLNWLCLSLFILGAIHLLEWPLNVIQVQTFYVTFSFTISCELTVYIIAKIKRSEEISGLICLIFTSSFNFGHYDERSRMRLFYILRPSLSLLPLFANVLIGIGYTHELHQCGHPHTA